MDKLFDLNIEQVLEHWEPEHAVREIIANALDEQFLTKSKEIEIYKLGKRWHIRDFGRGLQYSHFTQNENQEKLASPFLIGKFGVGLKDALAVFHRKNISVEINSKYGHVSLTMAQKSGFSIETLHAVFDDPIDVNFVGTEFIIDGISDTAIEKAKAMFLCFNSNLTLLEKTKYGEVYQCTKTPAIIYINGVQVATEENFLFSYNITNINAQIKKALNRERSNVGRTAYSDTIKNILRQCKSNSVLVPLVNDLQNIMSGTNSDESSWVDVATHAAKTLSEDDNVVFMTPAQRAGMSNQQVEILEQSGKTLVLVTDNVYSKIESSVSTFDTVFREYTESFSYKFIPIHKLTTTEKQVFELSSKIVAFLKARRFKYNIDIKVSETIRVGLDGTLTQGVYDPAENAIIIKRSALSNPINFCGVLLHEFAHYQYGHADNTRDFENDLTDMLGHVFIETIRYQPSRILPTSRIATPITLWKKYGKKLISTLASKFKTLCEKTKNAVFPKVKSLWTRLSKERSAIVEPESAPETESADLSPALHELWESADSVASDPGAPDSVCQYDTPFKPEIIYMPDKHFSAPDAEQSIVDDSGKYDFTRFSEYELRTINGAIQSVYKYPPHLRAIGLANESEGILYKARSVLFEMVIQKYADSLQPLDMLAVAFAYQSQGASSRQKAIEYFERAMPYLSVKDFSSFINFAPLGLYNKFSRLYEKEHEWDKAIYYLQLAEKYCDMDAPYYKTHLQELEAKKEANKPLRRRKLKEEDLVLQEQLKSAAHYFLSQFNF